jgi:hypothetical protein
MGEVCSLFVCKQTSGNIVYCKSQTKRCEYRYLHIPRQLPRPFETQYRYLSFGKYRYAQVTFLGSEYQYAHQV